MKRKTINVTTLLNWANTELQRTDEFATVDFKAGICSMIEMVLFKSNNYNGFMFKNNNDSETGTLGYYSRFYYHPKN